MDGMTRIAVHDFGGEGPDVVLLHGGRRTHADWATIGGLLATGGYRAVAPDLRGHGDSEQAPWDWEAVLDDIEGLGLDRPIVVGHALGGMVAALWAGRHPECPLAVNVDGHGNPVRAERMLGMSPEQAEAAVASLRAQLDPLAVGLSPWLLDMTRQVAELDMPAVHRATRCPLLVVSGTDTGEFADLFDEPGASAWRAGRAWVMADLTLTAQQVPLFEHAFLAGGHDLHLEDPIGLYGLITRAAARQRSA
jgi:pimeloyl-ACP methyl ester carboxylesterase